MVSYDDNDDGFQDIVEVQYFGGDTRNGRLDGAAP